MSRRSRKKVVERSRTCEAAKEDRLIDDVLHAQAERPDKRSIFRFILFHRITYDLSRSIKIKITTFDGLGFVFL